jgi:hypothetical protein
MRRRLESPVGSFPVRSFLLSCDHFCSHACWTSFPVCSAGDISVLANCQSLLVFYVLNNEGIGRSFPTLLLSWISLLTNFLQIFCRWSCCLDQFQVVIEVSAI